MSKETPLPRRGRLAALPYTSPPPRPSTATAEKKAATGGFLSRIANFFGGETPVPADRQQQPTSRRQAAATATLAAPLRRDFLFLTPSGNAFFSRRQEESVQFGFHHGQLLQHTSGLLSGIKTTVVGVRGGLLWSVDEGSAQALPLTGSCHDDLVKEYGLVPVGNTHLASAEIDPAVPEEARNFLQTAPDLVVDVDGCLTPVHLSPTWLESHGAVGWSGEGRVVMNASGVTGMVATVVASAVIHNPPPE